MALIHVFVLSCVFLISPIPAIKNINPSIPKVRIDFTSRALALFAFTKLTAA